jgi:hypothetical protein
MIDECKERKRDLYVGEEVYSYSRKYLGYIVI